MILRKGYQQLLSEVAVHIHAHLGKDFSGRNVGRKGEEGGIVIVGRPNKGWNASQIGLSCLHYCKERCIRSGGQLNKENYKHL